MATIDNSIKSSLIYQLYPGGTSLLTGFSWGALLRALMTRIDLCVVLSDDFTSELEITENPSQLGFMVNDHTYMKPRRIVVKFGTNDFLGIPLFNLSTEGIKSLKNNMTVRSVASLATNAIAARTAGTSPSVLVEALLRAQEERWLFMWNDGIQFMEDLVI